MANFGEDVGNFFAGIINPIFGSTEQTTVTKNESNGSGKTPTSKSSNTTTIMIVALVVVILLVVGIFIYKKTKS